MSTNLNIQAKDSDIFQDQPEPSRWNTKCMELIRWVLFQVIKTETPDAETQGDRLQEIQQLEGKIAIVKAQRREVPQKVHIGGLPDEERPT